MHGPPHVGSFSPVKSIVPLGDLLVADAEPLWRQGEKVSFLRSFEEQ